MKPSYVLGVDLGKMNDFTAIVVAERAAVETTETRERYVEGMRALVPERKFDSALNVVRIERPEKLTPYPVICRRVRDMVSALHGRGAEVSLVVDATGVGNAVVDGMRELDLTVTPVVITGGHAASTDKRGTWHVPKKDLVTRLRYVYDQKRINVPTPEKLPLVGVLLSELDAFKMRQTAKGHTTYGNDWRESPHDDIVLALALAVWQNERTRNQADWERHAAGNDHAYFAMLEMRAHEKRLAKEIASKRKTKRFGY